MTLRKGVPGGWQSLTVEALALEKKGAVKIGPFGSQLKKSELKETGIKVYGQENILQDDFTIGDRFIDEAKFESLRSVQLFPGDVVLTMMGSVGASTVAPDEIAPGIMDSHLLRIQPYTALIQPEFLARVLRDSSGIKKQIRARSQGGIMSGLNARIVRTLEVPVPPLSEQRKIAAILSSVDDAIEKTEAVIDQVQVVKRGLMQELLTRGLPGRHTRFKQTEIGEIPETWTVSRIGELGQTGRPAVKAGPFGSSLKKSYYTSAGYRVYGQEQVLAGNLAVGDYYIDEGRFESLKSCEVKTGDVLVSLVGTFGKALVVPGDAEPGIINPRLLRVTLDSNLVLPEFFCYWLQASTTRRLLADAAQGGTMGVLNAGIVKNLSLARPSCAEQEEIVEILNAVESRLDSELEKKKSEVKLKSALMSVLLTGELRVTPDHEPA